MKGENRLSRFQDLTGQKFGKLIVIKRVPKPENRKNNRAIYWLCKYDCGNNKEIIVSTNELNSGNTKSCGCLKGENLIKFNKETKRKYNTYDLTGEYGIGYTFKGEEFYFDLEDYDKIKDYCWRISNEEYVICTINELDKKYVSFFHRHIINCPEDKEIDHINGKVSRNDNRKYNLRICKHQENLCNYDIPKNNTSGVKGVSYCNTYKVWKAYITTNNKRINLGSYNNFEDAVKIRKEAEIKYFKEFRWKGENNA